MRLATLVMGLGVIGDWNFPFDTCSQPHVVSYTSVCMSVQLSSIAHA